MELFGSRFASDHGAPRARPCRPTRSTDKVSHTPPTSSQPTQQRATPGDYPLQEYRAHLAGRDWSILHAGALLSFADEQRYLGGGTTKQPYGVILWPAAIALAHELASRGAALDGRKVLELGAGTGLPGLVAASLGARLTQTDRLDAALTICRENAQRNGISSIEYRIADWAEWNDPARYDVILGSDILYATRMHDKLRRIFERNLAPGGFLLLSDPFRSVGMPLLETLEHAGWTISITRWSIGESTEARAVGTYEVRPPS